MRKMAAGNWKMNGALSDLTELTLLAQRHATASVDILMCLPAPLIAPAQKKGVIKIGGQACHVASSGAHTGDISAQMLVEVGAKAIIVGHSERRQDHNEDNATVQAQARQVIEAGAQAIICIGETGDARERGETLDVLADQLAGSVPEGATSGNTVIAYEPVWAIGTGVVPTLEQIEEAHRFIRNTLVDRFGPDAQDMTLLYGGSVKGSNAAEIFSVPDVNGALVGGASLRADDFSPIITALEAS